MADENQESEELPEAETAIKLPIPNVSDGIRKISTHELHAAELGIFTGIPLAMLYTSGSEIAAMIAIAQVVLFALGFEISKLIGSTQNPSEKLPTKGRKTIRKEPWYFIGALLATWFITLFAIVNGYLVL